MFLDRVKISGKGQVMRVRYQSKERRVGVFPISIDYKEFSKLASTPAVSDRAWYIHENYQNRQILIGVDRLDYSKGIPERLKAFRRALQNYPDLIEKISFVQVVVPSRRDIAKYADLKIEIERLVGEINGEFTRSGWVPVHYMFTSLEREELVSYYRTAEIAFITPLKDGMNLVAKEYCASNTDENGILILSEFAGSAPQFQKHAILVNPHDIEGMATAIQKAVYMSREERKFHMVRMRQLVRKNNIFRWVDSFLQAAIEKNLDSFPIITDYTPSSDKEFFEGIETE
jgi:trehalose 6-phosphate synthase